MTKRFVIAFDVEGPIVNPDFDFAWLVLGNLVKADNLDEVSRGVKLFDEYDDNKWLHERGMEGHSTGATPIITSLLAIAYGAKIEAFLDLALARLKFTPGAVQVLDWLTSEKRIKPYFISSAHPAAVLPVGYKLGIPSSHIFCGGYQLPPKRAEDFDKQRTEKAASNAETMLTEVRERFPYERHLGSNKLRDFLRKYLEICGEMNRFYIGRTDESGVRSSRERQLGLLQDVRKEDSALADDLRYLLYSEDGIMGAHRKKRALMSIEKSEKIKRENIIYVGDSIVDADPIAYAGQGISINCTNRQALNSSKVNLATANLKSLEPIIQHVTSDGELGAELKGTLEQRIEEEISKEDKAAPPTRVFMANEIDSNIDAVISANRLCKDYIKKLQSNTVA